MKLNLTNNGQQLLMRALGGGATIRFTHVALGSGSDAGASASELSHQEMLLPINSSNRAQQTISIKTGYNNSDVQVGFRLTEIGVFAEDPDGTAELLYAYGYSPQAEADYVPAAAADDRTLETEMTIAIYVGAAASVMVEFGSGVYAMESELSAHTRDTSNPHRVSPAQIGAATTADLEAVRASVSSPFFIAATGADMVDTTKAYLYAGDGSGADAGLEHGAWYYWDGAAWIRGGMAVDDTLTLPGVAADAREVGRQTTALERSIERLYSIPYVPSNMSVDETGKILLSQGYINAQSGESGVTTNGKYYRTQIGKSGENTLLRIGTKAVLAVCGLPWVQWSCWSYAGSTNADATHSNTGNAYINASTPILIPADEPDVRFSISFRKADSTAFSASELSELKTSIKFCNATDSSLSKNGAPADAKAVRDELAKKSSAQPALKIAFFGDSITRGRLGDSTDLYANSIPVAVGRQLGIRCENFGVGSCGWCAGWTNANDFARNRTNAIGLLRRMGNPTYYDKDDPYNGYKFLGAGDWDDFNAIVLAFGTNDISYPLGRIEDLDTSLSYAEVMAWQTSAQDSSSANRTIVKAMYQALRYIRESEDNHAEGEPFVPNGKYMPVIICDPITGASGYDALRGGGYTKRQMCELYADFAAKFGCSHISNFDAPIDQSHIYAYLPDGVHPNAPTYDALGMHFSAKISGGGEPNLSPRQRQRDPDGTDIVRRYSKDKTETSGGLTFVWSGGTCVVGAGQADGVAESSAIDYTSALPGDIQPGDRLLLIYTRSPAVTNVRWRVRFFGERNDSIGLSNGYNQYNPIDVPDNAHGIRVSIMTTSNAAISADVTAKVSLVKMPKMAMSPPLIVSFVDDDTTNLTYVQRYRDACLHNEIYGTFAAISNTLGGGAAPTEAQIQNRELLLELEAMGFGVVTHCASQSSATYDQWHDNTPENVALCRADLAKALRLLRSWGFCNTGHWVTPYGVSHKGITEIARGLGMLNLISYNNGRHNAVQDCSRYFIRRVALGENDTDSDNSNKTMSLVKDEIDAAAAAGSAWIIITTHFNEWGGLAWDSTLDENGHPVGYARFNEVVQYALEKGFVSKTIPEAWQQYEPLLKANEQRIAEYRAMEMEAGA